MLDNEDMNVELDEMDIKQNLEDSRKPIEEEFNDDLYMEKIEDKIRTMEIDDYFQPEDDQLNYKGEWKRHFGLYRSLLVINGDPIFVLNPYWYNNIIILTLLIVLMYATLHKQQTMIHYTITIVLSVLTTLSYIIGALLNPGLYSARKESTKFNEEFSCETCEVIHYQSNVVHCELCDICIREWHHHSMLFGKCIGQGDLFYYYLFIVIIPVFGLNTLILYLK